MSRRLWTICEGNWCCHTRVVAKNKNGFPNWPIRDGYCTSLTLMNKTIWASEIVKSTLARTTPISWRNFYFPTPNLERSPTSVQKAEGTQHSQIILPVRTDWLRQIFKCQTDHEKWPSVWRQTAKGTRHGSTNWGSLQMFSSLYTECLHPFLKDTTVQ